MTKFFPVEHLADDGLHHAFDPAAGSAGSDLALLAAWALGGLSIALQRLTWTPTAVSAQDHELTAREIAEPAPGAGEFAHEAATQHEEMANGIRNADVCAERMATAPVRSPLSVTIPISA